MLPAVDGQHHDVFGIQPEIDRVRITRHNSSAGLSLRAGKRQRILGDALHERVHSLRKLATQACATGLVPLLDLENFIFGLRPKDNVPVHGSAQQLTAHFGPRNRGARILQMFCPSPVQFHSLVWREFKCALALRVIKTFPEGDRDLCPISGRKLQ
jgi:hypothetical protein